MICKSLRIKVIILTGANYLKFLTLPPRFILKLINELAPSITFTPNQYNHYNELKIFDDMMKCLSAKEVFLQWPHVLISVASF